MCPRVLQAGRSRLVRIVRIGSSRLLRTAPNRVVELPGFVRCLDWVIRPVPRRGGGRGERLAAEPSAISWIVHLAVMTSSSTVARNAHRAKDRSSETSNISNSPCGTEQCGGSAAVGAEGGDLRPSLCHRPNLHTEVEHSIGRAAM